MINSIVALFVSFVLSVVAYPVFIKKLSEIQVEQHVSEYALEEFKNKKKTPTFGGVVFVFVPAAVMALIALITKQNVTLLIALTYVGYAIIGLIDDYKIVKEGKNDGITPRQKMLSQLFLSLAFYFLYIKMGGQSTLSVPFIKEPVNLGWLYIPFIMFLFSGSSNAVNLTDGMDGLAAGTSLIAMIAFAYIAYNLDRFDVLLAIFAIIGGLIAFLIFNHKPAKIIMGDVGSLALGAAFASISVVLDKEILLAFIGGVFVFETVCVIIQRVSWKIRKKRVFKYTPIHYSFTLNGWKEENVVNFFYALGLAFAIIGLALNAFF